MNKLRDRRGFTLTELLCAVLIVLLVSALLTVGVRFAGRTYNSSMQLSEAQELCSTLTSVISDKLRFCGTVTPGADGSLDHNNASYGNGGVRPAFFVESGIALSVEPDQVELSTSALLAEFTSKQLVEEVLRRIAEGQEDGDDNEEDDF